MTRIVVEPLEMIADAFGKSFRALFQHLPIQWQPVMFIACTIIIILCLILLSGIRINTPLFQIGVGVDPAVANASLERLQNQIQELRQEIRQQVADAVDRNAPPAIENIPLDNDQNDMRAIIRNMSNMVNAVNERTQQHGELLQRLRPVVDQARQAEAIEHPEWELVGVSQVEATVGGVRTPVQATEHNPSESD